MVDRPILGEAHTVSSTGRHAFLMFTRTVAWAFSPYPRKNGRSDMRLGTRIAVGIDVSKRYLDTFHTGTAVHRQFANEPNRTGSGMSCAAGRSARYGWRLFWRVRFGFPAQIRRCENQRQPSFGNPYFHRASVGSRHFIDLYRLSSLAHKRSERIWVADAAEFRYFFLQVFNLHAFPMSRHQ